MSFASLKHLSGRLASPKVSSEKPSWEMHCMKEEKGVLQPDKSGKCCVLLHLGIHNAG